MALSQNERYTLSQIHELTDEYSTIFTAWGSSQHLQHGYVMSPDV